ncbi:MAG: hypothetical protein V4648_00100, partial [Bacteroidota bacterium]
MNLNKFTKENVTIGFYIIYILIAAACYELFPGDAKTPNMGVLLFFLLIPIGLIYAFVHAVRHINSTVSYMKCFLIHITVWISIIAFL